MNQTLPVALVVVLFAIQVSQAYTLSRQRRSSINADISLHEKNAKKVQSLYRQYYLRKILDDFNKRDGSSAPANPVGPAQEDDADNDSSNEDHDYYLIDEKRDLVSRVHGLRSALSYWLRRQVKPTVIRELRKNLPLGAGESDEKAESYLNSIVEYYPLEKYKMDS